MEYVKLVNQCLLQEEYDKDPEVINEFLTGFGDWLQKVGSQLSGTAADAKRNNASEIINTLNASTAYSKRVSSFMFYLLGSREGVEMTSPFLQKIITKITKPEVKQNLGYFLYVVYINQNKNKNKSWFKENGFDKLLKIQDSNVQKGIQKAISDIDSGNTKKPGFINVSRES